MAEPVSLEEAKARLGVRSNHRDAELDGLIPAARRRIEGLTGHILVRRTLVQAIPRYAIDRPVDLHYFPVFSLDGVEARDREGVLQAVDDARLIAEPMPSRVYPPFGSNWPAFGDGLSGSFLTGFGHSHRDPSGLVVTMTAGYAPEIEDDPFKVIPEDLLLAVHLLIGHYFENHEATVVGSTAVELPLGVKDICGDYRLPGIE